MHIGFSLVQMRNPRNRETHFGIFIMEEHLDKVYHKDCIRFMSHSTKELGQQSSILDFPFERARLYAFKYLIIELQACVCESLGCSRAGTVGW